MSIIIALGIILLAFYLLAIITDGFLAPAIDKISKNLRLSSDAAGATLQAFGYSAPEFFIVLIAILGLAGGGNADIGTGTIVGSAIFNVLVIIGVVATFKSVSLQWQPIIRDQGFYIVTILLLLVVFYDGRIVLLEAILFVLMYLVYIFAVMNWQKVLHYRHNIVKADKLAIEKNQFLKFTYTAVGYLIPSPRTRSNWYMFTFTSSIIWIGILSFLLVQQVNVIGEILSINTTFLALIFLAAGTSILDLIESIKAAKHGHGEMAVSNAFGSNIFYILFALGVPWIIYLLSHGGEIIVGTENLVSSIVLLFATVAALAILLVLRKWKIGRSSGYVLVGLYILYAVYIIASAG